VAFMAEPSPEPALAAAQEVQQPWGAGPPPNFFGKFGHWGRCKGKGRGGRPARGCWWGWPGGDQADPPGGGGAGAAAEGADASVASEAGGSFGSASTAAPCRSVGPQRLLGSLKALQDAGKLTAAAVAGLALQFLPILAQRAHRKQEKLNRQGVELRPTILPVLRRLREHLQQVEHLVPLFDAFINGEDAEHLGDLLVAALKVLKDWVDSGSTVQVGEALVAVAEELVTLLPVLFPWFAEPPAYGATTVCHEGFECATCSANPIIGPRFERKGDKESFCSECFIVQVISQPQAEAFDCHFGGAAASGAQKEACSRDREPWLWKGAKGKGKGKGKSKWCAPWWLQGQQRDTAEEQREPDVSTGAAAQDGDRRHGHCHPAGGGGGGGWKDWAMTAAAAAAAGAWQHHLPPPWLQWHHHPPPMHHGDWQCFPPPWWAHWDNNCPAGGDGDGDFVRWALAMGASVSAAGGGDGTLLQGAEHKSADGLGMAYQ